MTPKAPKFSEWHQQKIKANSILHVSKFYDALSDTVKHRLDQLIETYITELLLEQRENQAEEFAKAFTKQGYTVIIKSPPSKKSSPEKISTVANATTSKE